jgi:hypothetical protein
MRGLQKKRDQRDFFQVDTLGKKKYFDKNELTKTTRFAPPKKNTISEKLG